MPIQTPHPSYGASIDKWTRCRDAYNGDDAIKAQGQIYLPKIDKNQTSDEYEAYARRASYFEAVGKTVDGFLGAISRRPHKFNLPTAICAMEVDASGDGVSLSEKVKQLCKEVLLQGRVGMLVDFNDTLQRPYISTYLAEMITWWSNDRIVLHETVFEADEADPYKLKPVQQYRELALIDGVYTVNVWRKVKVEIWRDETWIVESTIVPSRRGKTLDSIPFFFVTPIGQTSGIDKPPLLGLVNLSLEHYRLSSDYAHGLHWTALPTFYITGADNDDPVTLGSATAIQLKDPQAKVGYCEFRGDGLGSLERAIAAKESQMAALGAAVLSSETRKQPETATAAQIRHGGETSLLSATVSAVQSGLQSALQYAADWMGGGKVTIELNDDFCSVRLDPSTLLGLVQAYQVGALTLSSLLTAMQDGDLLPQKAIITDEVASLAAFKDRVKA